MAPAVVGLIGVCVGALLNGGIAYVVERAKHLRGLRQASRLCAGEFNRMALIAEISHDHTAEGGASDADDVDLMLKQPAQVVRSYLSILADGLTYEGFRAVSEALGEAEAMSGGFYGDAAEEWNEVNERCESAVRALAAVSDGRARLPMRP